MTKITDCFLLSKEEYKKYKDKIKNIKGYWQLSSPGYSSPYRINEGLGIWTSFYRANPHRFAIDYLGMTWMTPIQQIILNIILKFTYSMIIASRGFGKTIRNLTAVTNSRKGDNFMKDIYNPDYYKEGKIETADFICDKELNFFRGNVIKYVVRAGKKDKAKEIEDLKKAKWYLDREIRRLNEDGDRADSSYTLENVSVETNSTYTLDEAEQSIKLDNLYPPKKCKKGEKRSGCKGDCRHKKNNNSDGELELEIADSDVINFLIDFLDVKGW